MSGYQDSNLIPSRSQSGCDTGPRYRPQTKKGHQMVTSLSGYQDSNPESVRNRLWDPPDLNRDAIPGRATDHKQKKATKW